MSQWEVVLFSRSAVSNSLWPHGLQHARLLCPSPSPGACSNSCPLSQWCHPTISSSVIPFPSCPQSFPASGSFPVSQFFTSGGQSIGVSASASVVPMNIQDWFPLGLTGLIFCSLKNLLQHHSSKASILLGLNFLYSSALTSILGLTSSKSVALQVGYTLESPGCYCHPNPTSRDSDLIRLKPDLDLGVWESPQASLLGSQDSEASGKWLNLNEYFLHPFLFVFFLVISLEHLCRFVNLNPNLSLLIDFFFFFNEASWCNFETRSEETWVVHCVWHYRNRADELLNLSGSQVSCVLALRLEYGFTNQFEEWN